MNKNILIVLGILMLLFLPTAFAWDIAPDQNLVAYWNYDEAAGNALDVKGGLYPGTNYNVTYSEPGVIGTAYAYNGINAQTYYGASTNLYFPNDITVSGWIKKTGTTVSHMLSKFISYAGVKHNYVLGSNIGKALFYNERTSGTGSITSTADINDGNWHHVVGVGNSTGIYIYIDGNLSGFQPNTAPAQTLAVTASVKTALNYSGLYFSLRLDEVGIWNRALSAADINLLYNQGKGTTYCAAKGTITTTAGCYPGILKVSVKDEKTWADLNNVAFTINGTTYTTTKQAFDINLALVTAGPTDIVISKSGYVTRHYMWDNDGLSFDLNFLLNPAPIQVQFQFKVPGTNIYAANSYVRLDLNSHDSNIWTIGRYLTDSDGKVIIPIDMNNQRYITSFSYGGSSYRIDPIYLTIKVPKDEATDLNITLSNYDAVLTNTFIYSYLNTNIQTNIYIIPNTVDYMSIDIDLNDGSYDPRTYFLRFDSNDLNRQFLQPYLSATTTSINFITKNKNRNTIPYVDFLIYKNINGVRTQIMAGRTDITGSRLFPMVVGQNYSIDVFYQGKNYESAYLYTATATPVYWYLDTSTGDINIQQYYVETSIIFTPAGPKLLGTDTAISASIYGDDLTRFYWKIYQYNDLNMMTGKKYFTSDTGVCAGTNCLVNIPIPTMDINKSFFVDFVFTNKDINTTVTKPFTKGIVSNLDPFRLAFNVRKDMGCSLDPNFPCSLGIIISVIITLLLLFVIMKIAGVFFGLGSLVIAMVLLGIFTFIGWFYWPLYIFLIVGAIIAGTSGFARGGGNV